MIHVRRRLDRHNQSGPPKTRAGTRKVPLPPLVANTLREWRLRYPRPNGEPHSPDHLVFPNGSGNPENIANIVQRGLKPTWVRAGVTVDGKAKYTGMHSLRHFYASWCINRKPDGGLELTPKMVQQRMGHSSIQVTMDVYGHLFPHDDEGAELAAGEAALLGHPRSN